MGLNPRWGYVLSGGWLIAICALGVYIPSSDPGEVRQWKEGEFKPIMKGLPSIYQEDQLRARRIVKKARRSIDEKKMLDKRYSEMPPFTPPQDGRFTEEHVKKYIGAYNNYVRQRKHFERHVVGENPSFFSAFAIAGSIQLQNYLWKRSSFVKYQMRREEFNWILDRILECAIYCIQYSLEHDKDLNEVKRDWLLQMRGSILDALFYPEENLDLETVLKQGRIDLDSIPRSNLEIFLDHYKKINYIRVHFKRPVRIDFDREAILKAAANNPP